MQALIGREMARQDAKWGNQAHLPNGTGGGSSYLRALHAKVSCDADFERGNGTWAAILYEEICEAFAESDHENLLAELIQVAAVAQQWAAALLTKGREHHVKRDQDTANGTEGTGDGTVGQAFCAASEHPHGESDG